MGKTYDAAIIGGGVIGSSIAYHMAKKGMKVVLLEQDRLASQASGAAAGMLGAQAEMTEAGPLFELSRKSRSMFPQIAEELREFSGIDIGLVKKGMLKLALSADQVRELQDLTAFQREAGEVAEWISREEVRRMEPGVSGEVLGAMYIPEDGHVLAPELSLAFAQSAAVLGAQIKEFTAVHSLLLENGKIAGVITQEETIHCKHVVVTAGAWSGHLLQQAGIDLSVYPVKGECFSVVHREPLIQSTIFTHGCYIVPKKGGRIIVGATMIEHTYDRKVTLEGIHTLAEKAKQLVPDIVNAEWEKAWSGLRPQTADGLPYLGESEACKGLFIATGHFRNGILLSPITGRLIADMVEGERSHDLPISAFRVDRHTGQKGSIIHEI